MVFCNKLVRIEVSNKQNDFRNKIAEFSLVYSYIHYIFFSLLLKYLTQVGQLAVSIFTTQRYLKTLYKFKQCLKLSVTICHYPLVSDSNFFKHCLCFDRFLYVIPKSLVSDSYYVSNITCSIRL